MISIIFFALALIASVVYGNEVSNSTLDCKTFDPKNIKLVTFDVFAALMDLDSSLNRNIAEILPELTSKQVKSFSQQWESAYSNYAGTVFNETITGAHPFLWVLNSSLTDIITKMDINVSEQQFSSLIDAWSNLIPWDGVTETLQTVYNANFTIGTLSNGDQNTLMNAMKIFAPKVKFTYYFNSDFPNAGSFKPDARMYNQLPFVSGLSPYQILHVAGANIDGWGSRDDGLYSALVNSPPYPKKPFPCFLLKNITELPSILGIQE